MQKTREEVMADVLGLLHQLADDWEYTGDITPQTRFFADMNLASLDIVILGTAVQEHYSKILPFAELFADLGQRDIPDIPISEWVDFIHTHLNGQAAPEPQAGAPR